MEKENLLSLAVCLILMLSCLNASASGLDITVARESRLAFGHVVYFSNISVYPERISPGEQGKISFTIENMAQEFIKDIVIKFNVPSEISPYNDLTVNKIPEMLSGEEKNINFNFIVSPSADEGLYKIPVTAEYVNYIGDERTENETITLLVVNSPKILAEIKSTDIYKGNNLGNVKIKIINNNIGDVKFLLVELLQGKDFEIINSNLNYIGDLDSDDFSEISFRIKTKTNKALNLPLRFTYMDSMNKEYEQNVTLELDIRTASEMGVKRSYTGIVVIIILILAVGYIVYRRYRKKKLLKEKKGTLVGKLNF